VSLDLPPFAPRFPWWNADLQTLANHFSPPAADLAPHVSERLSFALRDGTGDTLLASLDRPAVAKAARPLAIVIHGLTGSEDSAPRYGFADAADYYERCKPLRFMADIRVPTLVLASLDDPWIPGALYSGYDWRANKSLVPLLSSHGGHVGFHGTGDKRPWSDRVVARFFADG